MTWIPMSARHPHIETNVLVFADNYQVVARLTEFGSFVSAESDDEVFDVTHWQPLPDSPEHT